jgi:hypothetical protein
MRTGGRRRGCASWLLIGSAAALVAPSAAQDPPPPCVPGTPCCFADADGDPWDLTFAQGTQTTRGSSPTGDWSYEFSICSNVAPNPEICEAAGVFGSAAVRFEGLVCEQLGPDIDLAPTAVAVSKTLSGVLMLWVAPGGLRSFALEIECGADGIPGLATSVDPDAPTVLWRQNGICDAGPGEPIPPVEEPPTSKWGRNFLIILGVGCFV